MLIQRTTDHPELGQLRALIKTLIDESGVIKPSIDRAKLDGLDVPGLFVEGLQLADGKAPTEFRIFKAGENTSMKGTFLFDELAAEYVMALYAKHAVDVMMDYEHMSLVKPPIIAPASAKRFVPEVRNGELWATQLSWTERARGMIEAGEYRYFSPAFDFDKETGRVLRLINVSLTNTPALDAIAPLAAASAGATDDTTPEDHAMAGKKMRTLTATCSHSIKLADKNDDGDEMECSEGSKAYCGACLSQAALNAAASTGTKVIAALGLSSDVSEQAALSAVNALRAPSTELATLTGQSNHAAQLGVISGWKQKAEQVDKLQAQLAEAQTATLSSELSLLLDQASKDGKLPPAEREMLEKRAKPDGKASLEGMKFAREYLSMRSPTVTAGAVDAPAAGIALTEDEAKIARLLGRDLKQAAADKAVAMGARVDK